MSDADKSESPMPARGRVLTLLCGVILPAIVIVVEATTHMCAESFFDPIPSIWHVLLVTFVPVTNLQAWLAVVGRWPEALTRRAGWLGLSNAVAAGIAFYYTILYVPLLPLAVVALLFMGLGILPMAPLFALISTLALRRQLRRRAPAATAGSFALRRRGLAAGLIVAALGIVLLELPATLTHAGMQMAASNAPERRAQGLRLLRRFGSEDYMLRACYLRSGRTTDLVGYLFSLSDPVSAEEARGIYYRVRGVPFDAVPPPVLSGLRAPGEEFEFDDGQGGEAVSGRLRGLSLKDSRLDGSLDADAGHGYMEWTLVFKNDSAMQREARAQVQLPPGGVVSRLTLWINGEEREAAFAGRSQVREAYQSIVRTRRDPVLVTTSGRDRVLVQCFPVQPGGEMKIRFGITTPLVLENRERGAVRLPYFAERNFGIAENIRHAVWIESRRPLSAAAKLKAEQPRADLYALRGALADAELSEPTGAGTVRAARAGEIAEAWTLDPVKLTKAGTAPARKDEKPTDPKSNGGAIKEGAGGPTAGAAVQPAAQSSRQNKAQGNAAASNGQVTVPAKAEERVVRQVIRAREASAPSRLVIVLDTSGRMRESAAEIAAAIRTLPPHVELSVVLADDESATDAGDAGRSMLKGTAETIAAVINGLNFSGGADNAPALARAWDVADAAEAQGVAAVVWIHGAQPVRLDPVENLRQRGERRPGGAFVYSVQIGNGATRIEEQLDGVSLVRHVPRLNGLQVDLEQLFAQLSGQQQSLEFVRTSEPRAAFVATAGAKETSAQLARLWARDEVERLSAVREQADAAMQLAVSHQLVTPLSGAVVLETQEQYRQAGLEPVAAGTVPTIPEPEIVLLIAIVALLVLWALWGRGRRHRQVC